MNYTGSNPPNNPKIEAVAIIPARYDSVRLPGKALLEIAGKPMICWVAERALAARNVSRVIVATDDERIRDAVIESGFEAVMTRADHASGTDRIAEVAKTLDEVDIIVNVQGDEPTISTETIERAVAALAERDTETLGRGDPERQEQLDTETQRHGDAAKRDQLDTETQRHGDAARRKQLDTETQRHGDAARRKQLDSQTLRHGDAARRKQLDSQTQTHGDAEIGIVTTWEPIESAADVLSPDVVKIVVDENERAVYFSRSPVPYPRDAVRQHGSLQKALENDASVLARFRKHTALYVYKREVLLAMARWPQSELERTESLEQLRALEHGVKIKAIQASAASIGVDTAAELERVRTMFRVQALA